MARTPTLDEIRIALFSVALNAVKAQPDVYVLAPAQEANPDNKMILLHCSFTPGLIGRAEIGGTGALARRHGIWRMTISTLLDVDTSRIWELAENLEQAFRPYATDALPVMAEGNDENCEIMAVFCDFPYTENAGIGPDNRNLTTVTVPWETWTES